MGIKSFQGARRQQNTDEVALKVRDYMSTNLITFTPIGTRCCRIINKK